MVERGEQGANERLLRRNQVLGLVLVALLVLLVALLRADGRALFPPGWWRF
jgi:hypothetical protein